MVWAALDAGISCHLRPKAELRPMMVAARGGTYSDGPAQTMDFVELYLQLCARVSSVRTTSTFFWGEAQPRRNLVKRTAPSAELADWGILRYRPDPTFITPHAVLLQVPEVAQRGCGAMRPLLAL
jgi:hypothetical protein